ncbi:hypothetical protein, partial [Klebsiella pneumoniae]|uniref:hypothetical protein n=1 Tax=Klebsiella pneumoniae TaxID=573 RepID=UPI001C60D565
LVLPSIDLQVGAIKAYRHVSDNDYHFNPSAAGVLPHLALFISIDPRPGIIRACKENLMD